MDRLYYMHANPVILNNFVWGFKIGMFLFCLNNFLNFIFSSEISYVFQLILSYLVLYFKVKGVLCFASKEILYVSVVSFLGFCLHTELGKILLVIKLYIIMGEKARCEVILTRNEV